MKKLLAFLISGFLFACNGNESADIKTTDQDHTAKDSAITPPLVKKDSTVRDSARQQDH
jgi:hypothetical protein